MLQAQEIFGPHDGAQWDGGEVALGRRLYRTLPEDVHDRGPLIGQGGTCVLVADLRLDNRDDLTRELRISAERARTLADADILMAAWERWGLDLLDRLVGDYAFALWDESNHRLVLARDPLGMRPLHYHRARHVFAFASMPMGLHALPEVPRAPDEDRVAEFLALLPESGSGSFFKDVERIEAGCVAIVTPTGVTQRRHWEPTRKTIRLASAADYAEALRQHLDQAVRAQLRGAGDVAAHLSSGFDSSAVATSAALILAPSGGKVVAFTAVPRVGYDGPDPHRRHGDEGPIAASTAALYPNMEHVLIRSGARSPLDSLDLNFRLYDRPMLNLCNNVWVHAINDAARERKLRVMLTGQMGNMSISYGGEALLPALVRRGRLIRWFRESAAAVRAGHMRWRGVLAASFGPYMPTPLWRWINRTFAGAEVGIESYSAIRPALMARLDIPARARARSLDLSYRPRGDGFESRLWVLRRVDLGNYVKGALGGWGIDQRDPTTDRRLIEFCLSVPEEQYFSGGEGRMLARRAFAGRVAPEVISTRGKGYQAVDWHEGLTAARGALAEEIARLKACGPAANAIDLARLTRLVEDWPQDGWETEAVTSAYRLALLRAVSVGHFLRKASGSNA
jgi:asparagine synthase (glutamine-hydrolysing)